MESFLLELKSICKSYKFLILILVLFLFQMIFIQQAMVENKSRERITLITLQSNVEGYERKMDSLERNWQHGRLAITPEQYEAALGYYNYNILLRKEKLESYLAKDWSEYSRMEALGRLLLWDLETRNINPTPQQYFGENWNEVKAKLNYPEFEVAQELYQPFIADEFSSTMVISMYYLELANSNLKPAGPHSTSPWAFLLNFLRGGFPHILGVIVFMATVNILHRDKSSGAIKSYLSSPKSRTRYLLRKLSLGFWASSIVLLLPQLFTVLFLGLKHGFQGLNYPILLDRYILSNLNAFPDHLIQPHSFEAGLSRIQFPFLISRLEYVDFAPLWQFLSLAAVQVLLFILFCTALALLISVLVKNEVIAHLVAAGTFIVGSAFGNIVPKLSTTAWDLFSKADVVPLLEGSLASTYLSSLLTLSVAAILIFIVASVVFRRQDIVSH